MGEEFEEFILGFNWLSSAKNKQIHEIKHVLNFKQQREFQNKTGWSEDVISYIHSMEEAAIYIKAGQVGENVVGGGHF